MGAAVWEAGAWTAELQASPARAPPGAGAAEWSGLAGGRGPAQSHSKLALTEAPDFEIANLGVVLSPLGSVRETLYSITTFIHVNRKTKKKRSRLHKIKQILNPAPVA